MTSDPKRFIIFAMRRSGHHAVANWLKAQIIEKIHVMDMCSEFNARIADIDKRRPELSRMFIFENQSIEKTYPFTTDFSRTIIILRDPYNNIASYMRRFAVNEWNIKAIISLWKTQADLFLDNKFYGISYNDWFKDVEYRKSICDELETNFTDNMINSVAKPGGGSSFDQMDYNGKAQEMDVLNRWKKVIDEPVFKHVLQDQELKEYSDEIFGPIIEEK